jgi:TonB family protein
MIAIIWKGTAILAAALVAAALSSRRSAALRHFLWTAAFAALLLLPALAWRIPRLPIATSPVASTVSAVATGTAPSPAPSRQVPWLAMLYATGCALAAARFLVGAGRTAWMVRRATPAPDLGADVVVTPAAPVPLAWGILRRVVVLPTAALEWPAERLRSVLLHERMHHRRLDLPAQAMAQAACALFWFHPLAWLGLARQRAERERACDDAVLESGIAPHDYAAHLVDVIRAVAARRSWIDAPAMAETSNLEARVRALLDGSRDRRPVSRRTALAIAAATAAVLLPLAALQVHAQAAGGTLTGIVRDPSGARVPGCSVTAKNLDGVSQGTVATNQVGEYRITGLASGQYTLGFSARGFARGTLNADLVSGAVAHADFNLAVGQITESVAVTGRKSAPVVPNAARPAPQRIRIGGSVQAAKLVRQPRPIYPPDLQQAGIEGTVVLQAIISKDGSVISLKVLKSVGHGLDEAAMDAVRQWRYEPTLLNGHPVETMTTITVEFQLEQ